MRGLGRELTEDRLIAQIRAALGEQPRQLRVGIGDDTAVWKVRRSHLSLLTTDALIDGVHFLSSQTTPRALGAKALAVNLSDIAAMGGTPTLALVALGVTDTVDEQWARDFYGSMGALARRYGCAIGGGDIVRSPSLTIAVTVAGEVRRSNLRLRSGARPGDVACVTGPLGLAFAGLALVRGDAVALSEIDSAEAERLRNAYETPSPKIAEGKFLGASRATHAMMDISDGLSLDAARMARASGVDLCLDLDSIRKHMPPALSRLDDPLNAVLAGGDDYELLAAVDPRAFAHVAHRFRARFGRELWIAGRFERGSGGIWVTEGGARRSHEPKGWDHFTRLDRAHDLSGT